MFLNKNLRQHTSMASDAPKGMVVCACGATHPALQMRVTINLYTVAAAAKTLHSTPSHTGQCGAPGPLGSSTHVETPHHRVCTFHPDILQTQRNYNQTVDNMSKHTNINKYTNTASLASTTLSPKHNTYTSTNQHQHPSPKRRTQMQIETFKPLHKPQLQSHSSTILPTQAINTCTTSHNTNKPSRP